MPEGLDASLRHLFAAFHAPDDDVGAGLAGLLDWVDAEGGDLVGRTADIDNVGAFELGDLTPDDVAPFEPRPDPDPAEAPGVIAVADLPCAWDEAGALLARPDQDVVFGDLDFYERTYVSDRGAWDGARDAAAFPGFPDDGVWLRTEDRTAATELSVTIPFELRVEGRQGRFPVGDDDVLASLFVTWMPERAEAAGGANRMEQSTTFEAHVQRGGQTLWVYASWAEVHTTLFEPDAPALLAISANTAQDVGERMADLCTGAIALP